MKITIVLMEEPTMAGNKYRIALWIKVVDGSLGCSSCVLCICSTTTMASSIMRPIEAAMAPSVMMFNVYPILYKQISVRQIVMGIVNKIVALALMDRRNTMETKMASSSPIHTLSVTLFTASCTKSA